MPGNSMERALELMELLEAFPGGLRNAEISRRLDIPTSTTSYIVSRLEQRGYLQRDPETRRYQVGLRVVALAHGALRELGFRAIAEPVLFRLAHDTGLSPGIGVIEGTHVLIVDRVEGREVSNRGNSAHGSDSRTREQRDIGRELPIHATALGKVLVAYMDSEAREELLGKLEFERVTSKTIVSESRFRDEIEAARKQGYARSVDEQYMGVRALCVPIRDAAGTVRAAVSLNGGTAEAVWRNEGALIEMAKIAATDISTRSRFV